MKTLKLNGICWTYLNHEIHDISLIAFSFGFQFLIQPCCGHVWRSVQILTGKWHGRYDLFRSQETNEPLQLVITRVFWVLNAQNRYSIIKIWLIFGPFPSTGTNCKNFAECFSKLTHIINDKLKTWEILFSIEKAVRWPIGWIE